MTKIESIIFFTIALCCFTWVAFTSTGLIISYM